MTRATIFIGLFILAFTGAAVAEPPRSQSMIRRVSPQDIVDATRAIQADPRSAQAYVTRGNLYRAFGDTDAAIADYTAALEVDAKFIPAHYGLGLTLEQQGRWEEAEKSLARAVELKKDSFEEWQALARVRIKLRRFDEAISPLDSLVDFAGKFIDPATKRPNPTIAARFEKLRGLCYLGKGDEARAKQEFDQAVQHDPAMKESLEREIKEFRDELPPLDAAGLIQRGKQRLGEARQTARTTWTDHKSEQAIVDISRAMALGDKSAETYELLAEARMVRGGGTGDFEYHRAAIADLNKALALTPDNPRLYATRAAIHFALAGRAAAIADYTAALQRSPKEIAWLLARARVYEWEQPALAVADDTAILAIEPRNRDAYTQRAFLRQRTGDLAGAIEDYDALTSIAPDVSNFWYEQGQCLEKLSRREEALAVYSKRLQLAPKDMNVGVARALCLERLQRFDDALAQHDQNVQTEPANAGLYVLRGQCREKTKRYADALADLKQAKELKYGRPLDFDIERLGLLMNEPQDAQGYFDRAAAWWRTGNLDAAISDYTAAIKLDPKQPASFVNRGLARAQKGRQIAGIIDLTRALDLNPQFEAAWLYRGKTRMEVGNLDDAIDDLTRAHEKFSRNTAIAHALAQAHFRRGDYFEAFYNCNQALSFAPQNFDYLFLKAQAADAAGRFVDAIQAMEAAVRVNGQSLDARYGLAVVNYRKGEIEGYRALQDVLQIAPQHAGANIYKGLYHCNPQEVDTAIASFNIVVNAAPQAAMGYALRGWALLVKGDAAAAKKDLDRAATDPAFQEFVQVLRELAAQESPDLRPTMVIRKLMEAGQRHLQQKEWPAAVNCFSRVVAFQPAAVMAYIGRATAFLELGEFDSAWPDAIRAEAMLRPDPVPAIPQLMAIRERDRSEARFLLWYCQVVRGLDRAAAETRSQITESEWKQRATDRAAEATAAAERFKQKREVSMAGFAGGYQ